jgi:hypothetical protein
MRTTETSYSDRMRDEAVAAATGKRWPEWFALLDAAGARKWTHQQIVSHLRDVHGVGSWWQQMVTVQYERESGLRDKHERPDGFQISVSRTIARPVAVVFEAWIDPGIRGRWLTDPGFTVRKANPCKTIRITWVDGATSVEAAFYEKGPEKCQVTAQHSKLPNAGLAESQKAYWSEQLDSLKALLECR